MLAKTILVGIALTERLHEARLYDPSGKSHATEFRRICGEMKKPRPVRRRAGVTI